jgi:hypothetical protein
MASRTRDPCLHSTLRPTKARRIATQDDGVPAEDAGRRRVKGDLLQASRVGAPTLSLWLPTWKAVGTALQAIGADDRNRDMMRDPAPTSAAVRFRPRSGRSPSRPGFRMRRVSHVDDDSSVHERLGQTLAGDRGDARVRRGGNRLVAFCSSFSTTFDRISPVPPIPRSL